MKRPGLDRRRFLKCSSYALALPFLASLPGAKPVASRAAGHAKRLVCAGAQLGFYKPDFFGPAASSRLLRPLDEAGLSGDFTTISGLDHKGPVGNGHDYVHTLYTGSVAPGISLDQAVAQTLGRDTRYESIQLCSGKAQSLPSLSFSASGVPLPATIHPSVLYAQVFGGDSVALDRQKYLIDSGRSMLDELRAEAKTLERSMNAEDRRKLDEYFSSIRGLERRLKRRDDWVTVAFPEAPKDLTMPVPEVVDGSMMLENEDLMWDLITLAFQNDSTRVISFTIPNVSPALLLDGSMMSAGYHQFSHHGLDPEMIQGLLSIEERHMRGVARFMSALKQTPDPDGGNMLDSTVLLLGSAMADASTHGRVNFPMLVAGGGFKHKGRIACEAAPVTNRMACDLYVTALQRLGFETEVFGSSQSDLNAQLL